MADHPAANHPAANHPAADEVLRSLLDPADRGSPYPYYHRLRELDPVHRSTAPGLGGAVVLTRYRDMERVMRSPRSYKDRRISPVYGAADDGPFSVMMRGLLPAADPPDHARRRGLLQKAFTPRALQQLEGHVVDVADGLLDGLRQQGPGADLVAHFAYQLPVIVICELLGVPVADRHRFVEWSRDFSLAGDVSAVDAEVRRRGDRAAEEFDGYLRGLAGARRDRPEDDLITRMVEVTDGTVALSVEDIVGLTFTLLQAGHSTTSDLIGMGTLALLRHPDQLALVRDDPEMAKVAVEELIRHDTPVHLTVYLLGSRMVFEGGPAVGGGQSEDVVLDEDTLVLLALAAGNHDPDRFTDPDGLDIRRDDVGHLGFGFGAYHCLGSALARMEARVAFPKLFGAFPDLRLDVDPADVRYRPTLALHGLEELPVAW